MADGCSGRKPFHIIATEVLGENEQVKGYSITSPEYPLVDSFCENAEDIIDVGCEAKENASVSC